MRTHFYDRYHPKRAVTRARPTSAVVAVAALTCGLAACGGGSDSSNSAGGLTEVSVGGQPNIWGVPVQLAQDKGYFKKHGLKLKTISVSASTGTSSLKSGSIQFLPTSPTNFATAIDKKLPFVSISSIGLGNPLGLVVSTKFAKDNKLTASSSPQDVAKALANSKPGASSPNTKAESEMFLKQYGVDGSKLNWVTLPTPSADQAAIANNQIDWFLTSEPLPLQIEETGKGLVVVGPDKYTEWGSESGYGEEILAQTSYAKQHSAVTKDFVAAVAQATKFMHDHPTDPTVLTASKEVMTGASDAVLKKTLPLATWSTDGKQDQATWNSTVSFMNSLDAVEGGAKVGQADWTNTYVTQGAK